MVKPLRLLIVAPIYNDWEAFERLLEEINETVSPSTAELRILGIDDGSSLPVPKGLTERPGLPHLGSVEIVSLRCNVGHQRAIAVGLALASSDEWADAILIMDSDGEDRPEDIAELIRRHQESPTSLTVAERSARSEGTAFRLFYKLYKFMFRALTGQSVSFGNFSLIPRDLAQRLLYVPAIWNNLAAAMLQSQIPITRVPTRRGSRYAGKSRMNFVSLVIHGLGAISVFAEAVFVRLLILCLGMVAASMTGAAVVVTLRLFTDLATPGWATTLVIGLSIISLQAVVIAMSSAFIVLSSRSSMPDSWALHANRLVLDRKHILCANES